MGDPWGQTVTGIIQVHSESEQPVIMNILAKVQHNPHCHKHKQSYYFVKKKKTDDFGQQLQPKYNLITAQQDFVFLVFIKTLIWTKLSSFCGYIYKLFMSLCLYCLSYYNMHVFLWCSECHVIQCLETTLWTHPSVKRVGIPEVWYVTLCHLFPF